MNDPAVVLVCGRLAGIDLGGLEVTVVDDLCRRPQAAADALRAAGATRVVLGLCETEGSTAEIVAACRRAGAAPFGIEAVRLRTDVDPARQLESALAKVRALPAGERGKPALSDGGYSRRALLSLVPALSVSTVAVLDAAACAGGVRCGLCLAACPHEALACEGRVPVVDRERCEACGLCVPACPTGALHLAGASGEQLEAQLGVLLAGRVAGIVFACAGSVRTVPPGWFEVEVPALSLVTPGWVLQLLARGVPAVRLAPCAGECCTGSEPCIAFCRRALEALGDGQAEARVASSSAGVEPALDPLAAAAGDLTLSEPRATAEALLRLATGDARFADGASPLGLLTLSPERCTVCGACGTACPTQAIVLEESSEETAVRHDAARCVPCGRCVEACPEDALEVRAGLDLGRLRSGLVTLIRSDRETCSACGAELPPLPMRRRIRELLADSRPDLAGAPQDLCAGCLFAGRGTLQGRGNL